MTLKEMKKERDRLNKLIKEAEEGRFLKHKFLQAEFINVQVPDRDIIKFCVKLYAKHMWHTLFYADSAKQAVDDLGTLRDALDRFIMEFSQWAEQKEAGK